MKEPISEFFITLLLTSGLVIFIIQEPDVAKELVTTGVEATFKFAGFIIGIAAGLAILARIIKSIFN